MSVDVSDSDRQIYERELRDFLPPRIFDSHLHLFERSCLVPTYQCPPRSVFGKFGGVFPIEQCLSWAKALLPEHEYHLNSLAMASQNSDFNASAAYSGRISDNRQFFAMALVSPHDTAEAVIKRVESNHLIGYKPYPDFVDWKDRGDITIHDMLPAAQMEAADERGLAVTLHIPRPGRLADPLNQVQMVELCQRYPRAQIIFAHIGRAYYLSNVISFLDGIAACPNAYVDTSMVNHEGVLEYTLCNFPRDRILFGSDAPVAFLRGKSVEINNQYAYLMGEDYEIGSSIYDSRHSVTFTTFFYEQLRAIKLAAQRAGLSRVEIDNLFFHNASRLFQAVAARNYGNRKD